MPETPMAGNICRSTTESIAAGSPKLDGLKPRPWFEKTKSVRANPRRAVSTIDGDSVCVFGHKIARPVLLDHAAFGDREFFGKGLERDVLRIPVRIPREESLVFRNAVIDSEIVVVQIGLRGTAGRVVVRICELVTRLIWQREVFEDVQCDRIDLVLGNLVVGELLADGPGRGERIENSDQGARLIEGFGEIAVALLFRRHGSDR